MQWDCTALALQDATGLLPRSGALYLFADLTGSDAEAFRFVHAAGPAKDWRSLQVPAKLLLPQWPFTPLAFQLPAGEDDRFWNEGEGVGEALLRLQHPQGVPPAKHLSKTKAPFGRPFPEFPHDYAAIRIVTAKVLRQLEHPVTRALREASASVPAWREEATRRAALAAAQRPEARVDPALSDEMWHWMEGLEPVLRLGWDSVVDECVEASLGMGSEARSVLPQERLAACAERHQLASAYLHEEYPDRRSPEALAAYEKRKAEGLLREVRTIHAPCPNHMFGPPSFVQGYVEDYLDTWVLLLELSSREPLGHEFGEGVFQFMIQPADLRDGRFDKTKLVASAY